MTMMVPFTLAAVGDIVLTRPSIPGSGVSEGLATMLAWLRQATADWDTAGWDTPVWER